MASNRSSTFSSAVETVLKNWTALQLAVQNQFGGPNSQEIADWMVSVVENFFYENDGVIADEVADYVGEIMNNEFNTMCDDGSLEEVGIRLCRIFRQVKEGKDEEVLLELKNYKGSGVGKCKAEDTPTCDTGNENIDAVMPISKLTIDSEVQKQCKNQPDEDGWITVSKGKKG